VHPPPSKSGKRFKLLYATQVVPEVQRPFGPPEFLLFVNDEDLITDSYREYLFNRFRERWPFPGLPIRLRLKSRESRAVQDRKKAGARAALSEEALWKMCPRVPQSRRSRQCCASLANPPFALEARRREQKNHLRKMPALRR